MGTSAIWTIGHSNHAFDTFAERLRSCRIEFVVDVRSYPYSRIAPRFNREHLESALEEAGTRYVFLGVELGGRPSKDSQYDAEGRALYGLMAREPGFQHAVDRVAAGATRHRIALLCSEGRPEHCHRRLLVGKVLTERGIELRHILPDGSLVIEQIVDLGENSQASLFGSDSPRWRSTQSVSHRRRLSTSSAG